MPLPFVARIAFAALLTLPALWLRLQGATVGPLASILLNGGAVVAAAFLLAWAAEAAQKDISGNLALALLALIAVLPEYAIDLYFGYSAGHDPQAARYAAANMTGSNRLLLGLGWPLVLFLLYAGKRRRARFAPGAARIHSNPKSEIHSEISPGIHSELHSEITPHRRSEIHSEIPSAIVPEIVLDPSRRVELGALGLASLWCLFIPFRGHIGLVDAAVLLALFAAYLWRASREEHHEPELVGTAHALGELLPGRRRAAVLAFFLFAALAILAAAQPFADALVHGGRALGLDEFLLVQWLAPFASEAPEFLVAAILALRGNGDAALGALLSSKVNQWTMLVGSLPLAHLAGGGSGALPLDARQFEELLLTATQALLGFAVLCDLRLRLWEAILLLALFASQLCFIQTEVRLAFAAAYAVAAAAILLSKLRELKLIVRTAVAR